MKFDSRQRSEGSIVRSTGTDRPARGIAAPVSDRLSAGRGVPGSELTRPGHDGLTAPSDSAPDPLLNIGITVQGLEALGVAEPVLAEARRHLPQGPRTGAPGGHAGQPQRSRPAVGVPFATPHVHCVVHLQDAPRPPCCWPQRRVLHPLRATPGRRACPTPGRHISMPVHWARQLHFGYTDGHFHPDTARPTPRADPGSRLPRCPARTRRRRASSVPVSVPVADLVRDSAYGAFRWIYQDVPPSTQFLRTTGLELLPAVATSRR